MPAKCTLDSPMGTPQVPIICCACHLTAPLPLAHCTSRNCSCRKTQELLRTSHTLASLYHSTASEPWGLVPPGVDFCQSHTISRRPGVTGCGYMAHTFVGVRLCLKVTLTGLRVWVTVAHHPHTPSPVLIYLNTHHTFVPA